jgi:hypothetical protein
MKNLEILEYQDGSVHCCGDEPQLFAPAVTMPVLMLQVLEDAWTKNPEDAQKTFDLISNAWKELFWIENSTKRFRDGYNHFGKHPEKVLGFYDKHLK